jgi:CBS domain-containing protein
MMTVQSIMTSKPAACDSQANLAEVAHIMWERDCGIVPVTDPAGKVIGVVTDRDICIAASTRDRAPSQIRVSELPRGDVAVCRQDDGVENALALMRERRVRRLPVTGANGELLGIVSMNDIVLAAGERADIGPVPVLEAMKGICTHGAQRAAAAKAATA